MEAENILTGFSNLILKELGLENEGIEKMANEKIKICNECPKRNGNRCMVCGCFIKAKVRSESKCPENKF